MNPQDRALLHALARSSFEAAVAGLPPPTIPDVAGALARPGAAFVTLRTAATGELRGCIGVVRHEAPLVAVVRDMAARAATADLRFEPVGPGEVQGISLEISVLAPPRRPDRPPPAGVTVGRHGLVVTGRRKRGLLLPQVATDQGWDAETFLDHACLKAGLPRGAWRDGDVDVEVFEAEVF